MFSVKVIEEIYFEVKMDKIIRVSCSKCGRDLAEISCDETMLQSRFGVTVKCENCRVTMVHRNQGHDRTDLFDLLGIRL